ncbi:hypothetical protein Cgig2_010034 [Carnegiea gigantea]|uniref:SWIM-type domain-containing protein n=1 Tax=Carnegiea gigantea TaxID=171969 RepID=A0A9Q1GT20_9CARY|nr:hypothetical protein Cgig2_010034 [Carnegiea gigantea]
MVTKNVLVHYKDRMITIVDVNLDMYQVIDLFRAVRELAVEQGVVLPEYAGFKWHPPGRENQRWPLNTDGDWVMLVHQWESVRGFVIPIYVVELHVPSQLQKVVESLDGLQKAKDKETVQCTSPCEPTVDPSLNEAGIWADNLIVTPSAVYIDPNAALPVQPMSKGTSHALKKPSTSGRQKLQIRRPIPRAAKNKPNASLAPSSLQPSLKQANTVLEPVSSPSRPLTRSQSSPSTKSAVPITPSSSQPSEALSQVVLSPTRPFTRSQKSPIPVEKREAEPSSVATGRRTKSRPQLLNTEQSQSTLYSDQDLSLVRVDLDDFHDFDVLELGQPQIPQLDVFDSDVDENAEAQVEEYLESDSEDSDFNVDEHEESDEVSLDDESDDNEVVDDLDLELDTQPSEGLSQVVDDFDVVEGCTNFTVKLKEHFCDCKKWQITGLPCKHGARCILRMKGQLEDYCAPCFSTDNYRKLYDNIIHPISDPCMCGDTSLPTLDPPVELRRRGRPEKHHRRESASWAPVPQPEAQGTRHFSGTKRCKQCKQLGHTSLTCGRPRDESGRLMEKYKKKRKTTTRPVGRPRKTLCTTGTSAGTSDPTSTATEGLPSQFSQS